MTEVDRERAGYAAMARRAAAAVLACYSTSFGAATRLLPARERADIRALYAVVRIADEIVDSAAGLAGFDAAAALDSYEAAVRAAAGEPFHTDPVLHAFAATARRCRFTDEQLAAFFAAMRADLPAAAESPAAAGEPGAAGTAPAAFTRAGLARYIHGSAEVVGEMCVHVFLAGPPTGPRAQETLAGARRLGAAFQKVNFLRDLRHDRHVLGRDYVPWVTDGASKSEFVAEIRAGLDAARASLPELPARARLAVSAAIGLYGELTDRLDAATWDEVTGGRIRVPGPVKARVLARTLTRRS
ncbi:phytoene/squalene synthase family protein [Corynebacterium frankenforstense]|nr:squalene/phytoene synthase family protein [Corynebacterium frankenforstense]